MFAFRPEKIWRKVRGLKKRCICSIACRQGWAWKNGCPSCLYARFEPHQPEIPWIPTIWAHVAEMGELSRIEPPRMNWLAADLPTEFASFRQYCELIFRGPFTDRAESVRVTYIFLWVGQEGLRMYITWDLSDSESKTVNVICGRFKALIEPKANFWLSILFNLQKFRQTA